MQGSQFSQQQNVKHLVELPNFKCCPKFDSYSARSQMLRHLDSFFFFLVVELDQNNKAASVQLWSTHLDSKFGFEGRTPFSFMFGETLSHGVGVKGQGQQQKACILKSTLWCHVKASVSGYRFFDLSPFVTPHKQISSPSFAPAVSQASTSPFSLPPASTSPP